MQPGSFVITSGLSLANADVCPIDDEGHHQQSQGE
jgi:hypothetical protein